MTFDPFSSTLAFFGGEVARARTAAGMSQAQLAPRLKYSASQLAKVEKGQRIPSPEIAKMLDGIFGTDNFARLQLLVESTSVLPWFRDLVEVERLAEIIHIYESYLIPGLFQTEAYARAAVEVARPAFSSAEIDQAVALRLTRQEILTRDDPPRVWAVIDEAALTRVVGSPEIMREQMRHLLEVQEYPNVVIQIMRHVDGAACAYGRAFVHLSFKAQNDMVYLEDVMSARYIRQREEVARYALTFDYLRAAAQPDDKSSLLIKGIANGDQ